MANTLKSAIAVGTFLFALIVVIDAFTWSPRYGVPMLVVLLLFPLVLIYFNKSWKVAALFGAAASVLLGLILLGLTFTLY